MQRWAAWQLQFAEIGNQKQRSKRIKSQLAIALFGWSFCSVVAIATVATFGNRAIARLPQYLDERSTPMQVLMSYYNAINRREYVRAYYYWMQQGTSATSQPPVYSKFAAGFSDTEAVQLTTGKVSSQGAAGSIFYAVPVTLVATQTNGLQHTFVGCYTIRQPNPKLFGAPPFIPMGIYSAQIQEVPSSANTAVLMQQSCH